MGADNWTICPRCKKIAEANIEKDAEKVQKLYGKVSAAEYASKLAGIEKGKAKPLEETFAEYYEVRTRKDGIFVIDYGGNCRACGFEFTFKEERNTNP